MKLKNRSVAANDVLPHVVYQNLPEAVNWLIRVFGFKESYRYGNGPRGAQMIAGRAAIQVQQARGKHSPAQLGNGTQPLTIFVDDVDRHHARANAGRDVIRSASVNLRRLSKSLPSNGFLRRPIVGSGRLLIIRTEMIGIVTPVTAIVVSQNLS